jgi:hypothetical protein
LCGFDLSKYDASSPLELKMSRYLTGKGFLKGFMKNA